MAKTKIAADPNLGKNLRFLMERRAALRSQTDVAERTGLSQSSIGRILRGEVNPSAAALARIAEVFGVDVGALYREHEVFRKDHETEFDRLTGAVSAITASIERRAKGLVPLITWREAAGSRGPEEEATWVTCPVPHTFSAFALEVQGVGMFDPAGPISFREGDRIFAEPQGQAGHKSIVLARLGTSSEAVLRQLIQEGGQMMLAQLNPSWPNRIAPLTEEDALVGVVTAKLEIFPQVGQRPDQP